MLQFGQSRSLSDGFDKLTFVLPTKANEKLALKRWFSFRSWGLCAVAVTWGGLELVSERTNSILLCYKHKWSCEQVIGECWSFDNPKNSKNCGYCGRLHNRCAYLCLEVRIWLIVWVLAVNDTFQKTSLLHIQQLSISGYVNDKCIRLLFLQNIISV